jgi:hypothetical protein
MQSFSCWYFAVIAHVTSLLDQEMRMICFFLFYFVIFFSYTFVQFVLVLVIGQNHLRRSGRLYLLYFSELRCEQWYITYGHSRRRSKYILDFYTLRVSDMILMTTWSYFYKLMLSQVCFTESSRSLFILWNKYSIQLHFIGLTSEIRAKYFFKHMHNSTIFRITKV